MGRYKSNIFAAKSGLKSRNAGIAMVRGVRRGDTPEIVALVALGFKVADCLPLERIGAGKLTVQVGRGGLEIVGLDTVF